MGIVNGMKGDIFFESKGKKEIFDVRIDKIDNDTNNGDRIKCCFVNESSGHYKFLKDGQKGKLSAKYDYEDFIICVEYKDADNRYNISKNIFTFRKI